MDLPPPPSRFLVLGGGFSGLVAAWHLGRMGLEGEVWEASGSPGGWVQTVAWPGPQGEPGFLERGPQFLRMGRGGALARLAADLNLPLHQPGPKGPRWLGRGGRRFPGPSTLAGLARAPGMGLGGRLRMLAEPFIPDGGPHQESLRSFMARRLGPGFARELLPALAAGFLAAPPERVGMEAIPRLKQMEARGGLLLGGLRAGPERTWLPEAGAGTLIQTMTDRLGNVLTGRRAEGLEPLPDGRWRIHGGGVSAEAGLVILALPARAAAALLAPLAPGASEILEAMPALDLRVWHSRHPSVPGWTRGFSLLIHPPENEGLLGAVALAEDDPRGVPGLLQVRTYVGGAFPVDPSLNHWPGVFRALQRWLPELGEALQVREEICPGAFPLLEPGHGARMERLLAHLPPNLHWIGAARSGPGLPGLAESLEAWAETLSEAVTRPGPSGR